MSLKCKACGNKTLEVNELFICTAYIETCSTCNAYYEEGTLVDTKRIKEIIKEAITDCDAVIAATRLAIQNLIKLDENL